VNLIEVIAAALLLLGSFLIIRTLIACDREEATPARQKARGDASTDYGRAA
jgi:hypothetical protein